MSSVARISPDVVSVQPGGEAVCEVRIRNTGTVVDQFVLEALGEAASWVTFEPSSVSLFPDAEGVARLVLRPPRAPETPAGPCAVGVRVRSAEDPEHPVVEELTAEVGTLSDTFAELLPRTGRGRRRSAYHLAVDNRGNTRLNATFDADDPDDRLGFRFNPPAVVADPGTAAFAKVSVRPLKRFLRGQPITHPFQVRVEPEDEAPVTVEGTMLQEALIPRWMPRALLGLLIATWACVVLWALVVKPEIKSAAQEVYEDKVSPELAKTSAEIARLAGKIADQPGGEEAGGAGGTTAGGAPTGVVAGGEPVEGGDTGGTEPAIRSAAATAAEEPAVLGSPHDGRLEATAKKQTVSYQVPDGQVFSLTDIFLQNPAGDRGLLKIQRGTTTLLAVRLENFRDLDYHFVSPVVFDADQSLTLAVECENPAPAKPTSCTPAAYYSGFLSPA